RSASWDTEPMTDRSPGAELPEHEFRNEFRRLVAVLSRRFGVHRLQLRQEALQTPPLPPVPPWAQRRLPHAPGPWRYRVALNEVLGALRREKRREPSAADAEDTLAGTSTDDAVYLEHEVRDGQLRMLFVCADPAIPRESQIVLALKTLCGFSVDEIALRLFQNPDGVYKRLQRARAVLREQGVVLDTPSVDDLGDRLPAVLQMLYLLFTEGYSSARPDRVIRHELCQEAIRLGLLLVEHPLGDAPEAHALLALMHLDAARFDARVDGAGGLVLLEERDRSRWDRELIEAGVAHLHRSARGDVFSRYHIEAAIAAEHCLARSYGETRWDEIARLYQLLDGVAPSPINTLNRAIALAEWQGPAAGLPLLEAVAPPRSLLGDCLWEPPLRYPSPPPAGT